MLIQYLFLSPCLWGFGRKGPFHHSSLSPSLKGLSSFFLYIPLIFPCEAKPLLNISRHCALISIQVYFIHHLLYPMLLFSQDAFHINMNVSDLKTPPFTQCLNHYSIIMVIHQRIFYYQILHDAHIVFWVDSVSLSSVLACVTFYTIIFYNSGLRWHFVHSQVHHINKSML